MTESLSLTLQDDATAAPPPRPGRRLPVRAFAGATLAAVGLGLGWLGGPWALAGGVAIGMGVWLARPAARTTGDTAAAAPEAPAAPTAAPAATRGVLDDAGTATMVNHVVPVWARQMEATRETADAGLAKLLESFSAMAGPIELLVGGLHGAGAAAAPGAIDQAVEAGAPELEKLLAASQRAFQERDAAVAELARCGDALAHLADLARQARETARHTRLVAFNASIEANRQGAVDKGNQAVAQEMRSLADRMGSTGDAMARQVAALAEQVDATRRRLQVQDTTPEELKFEIDLRARDALVAMLASVGAALQGSAHLREAGQTLSNQLDEAFVQFQFGDRVSQMLSIIANDMTQFVRWTAEHPHANATDATQWLAQLEASYTMEEQRSEHHGNVHIDRGSEVEFF